MNIHFQSTVIITRDFEKMKDFYQNILEQKIALDFGNCITFDCGLTLWKLLPTYPLVQKIGSCYHESGNKNLELCFETESFEEVCKAIKSQNVKELHDVTEENWGQMTYRFYDPENNLIEIGETIPCFVKRFFKQGMTVEEIFNKTSVSKEMIAQIVKNE